MTRALNIKIQDAIYSQLDQHAREHNVTKTQIVEKALSQWFSGNVDSSVENVDSSVDDVDVPSKTPKDKDAYLESSNDIEKIISNKMAEYLLGVTCPVPEDSNYAHVHNLPQTTNVDKDVDKNVDDVENSVDEGVDDVDSSVDGNVDTKPQPHNRSQLAKRLNCSPPTISNYLKKGTKHGANQFCLSRDPDGYYWRWYEPDKLFHPQRHPL